MREQDAVREFHETFGVGIRETPGLPPDRVALRMALLEEELAEVRSAVDGGDVSEVAKELADLVYVTFGAAVEFGIPLHEVFAEVHHSNMSKIWGHSEAVSAINAPAHEAASVEPTAGGAIVRRADGKVLKPPDYEPPDLSGLL